MTIDYQETNLRRSNQDSMDFSFLFIIASSFYIFLFLICFPWLIFSFPFLISIFLMSWGNEKVNIRFIPARQQMPRNDITFVCLWTRSQGIPLSKSRSQRFHHLRLFVSLALIFYIFIIQKPFYITISCSCFFSISKS